jgi:predicted PhzF superfamily epimerase YddE/YHI9
MAELHVLRVFCGPDGGGNPLGVFLDGREVAEERRQPVAAELGFSETVYVDDAATGAVRIFTPGKEIPFAGHPLVGTAWLLAREGEPLPTLRTPAGEVGVHTHDGLTYISGRPEWSPPFELVELGSPAEVDELQGPPGGEGMVDVWTWIDENAGLVRSRVFVSDLGIGEDEATGSAAILLAAHVDREIEIRQGASSLLHARPVADDKVEVGGTVELDEVRTHP